VRKRSKYKQRKKRRSQGDRRYGTTRLEPLCNPPSQCGRAPSHRNGTGLVRCSGTGLRHGSSWCWKRKRRGGSQSGKCRFGGFRFIGWVVAARALWDVGWGVVRAGLSVCCVRVCRVPYTGETVLAIVLVVKRASGFMPALSCRGIVGTQRKTHCHIRAKVVARERSLPRDGGATWGVRLAGLRGVRGVGGMIFEHSRWLGVLSLECSNRLCIAREYRYHDYCNALIKMPTRSIDPVLTERVGKQHCPRC